MTVWKDGDWCKFIGKGIQYRHDFSVEKSIEGAYEKVKAFYSKRRGTVTTEEPNKLVIERPFSFYHHCVAIQDEKGLNHNITITLSENNGIVDILCCYDSKAYPNIIFRPMYFETEAKKLERILKDNKTIWWSRDLIKFVGNKGVEHTHKFTVSLPIEIAYEKVLEYYQKRRKTIISENKPFKLKLERKYSLLRRVFALTDHWFNHTIDVKLSKKEDGVEIRCKYDLDYKNDIQVGWPFFIVEPKKLESFLRKDAEE